MSRQEFDAEYIQRLTLGDRATEEQFAGYFRALLYVKFTRRGWSSHDIEDMTQETFLRVIQMLRNGGMEHPERIGAYVNTVSNHVMLEWCRLHARHPSVDADANEPVDTTINVEGRLINEERKSFVQIVLKEMSERDSRILRMLFLEEVDRDEICKRMNVKRENFRVILHRAGLRFKKLVDRTSAATAGDNREIK